MVAVYCLPEDEVAQSLRESLLAAGIPCALVGPTHGPASILYKLPLVVFTPSAEIHGESLRRKLLKNRILSAEEIGDPAYAALAIEHTYLHCFGTDFANAWEDGIRFSEGRVYFRGHFLPLTSAEHRIMRLLFHSRGTYFLTEEIAAACLTDPAAGAAVHICNINNKSRRIALYPVIESRRFSGYRIPKE